MEVKASEGQADEAVMSMLTKDLPEYLQNVLLACGYDKVSAIAKIDVSTDVDKMLHYLNDNFDDHSM